jgi:hypothetical protein
MPLVSPFADREVTIKYGKEGIDQQGAADAEVQSEGLLPVPKVRPPSRLPSEVWDVPALRAGAGAQRRAARNHEVELVMRK